MLLFGVACAVVLASFPGLPLSRTAREEEKKKKKFFFTDEEIILTGSVDKTVKAWLWLVDWSVAMAIHVYIYFRHHEKLTHKWTFEGHQLGFVSVTTDPSGEGIVNIP